MSTATVTVALNAYPKGKDFTGKRQILNGTLAVQAAAATYAVGGLAVSWAGLLDGPATNPIYCDVKAASTPSVGVVNPETFVYVFNEVTNKLQIFTSNGVAYAGLAELADGTAIPQAVSSATIAFKAEFSRAF